MLEYYLWYLIPFIPIYTVRAPSRLLLEDYIPCSTMCSARELYILQPSHVYTRKRDFYILQI